MFCLQAIVIILAGTWEKAERLYFEIQQTLEHGSKLRVLLIHGGGQEDNKAVRTYSLTFLACFYFLIYELEETLG